MRLHQRFQGFLLLLFVCVNAVRAAKPLFEDDSLSFVGQNTASKLDNINVEMNAALGREVPSKAAIQSRVGSQLRSVGSLPPTPSTSGLSRGNKGASSYIEAAKPKIGGLVLEHLFEFTKNAATESCETLSDELLANEATAQAHMHFTVLLDCLNSEAFNTPGHFINRDKNADVALQLLAEEMINEGGAGGSGDLINYIHRMIICRVRPLDEGRTIIQKLIFLGMEKSFKSPYVEMLLRGAQNYDPALFLDWAGNNLLHLAAASQGYNMPTVLFKLESKKNADSRARKMNAIYWMVSALEHRNDAGLRPVDVPKDEAMKDKLQKYYRAFSNYLNMRMGVTTDSTPQQPMEVKSVAPGGDVFTPPGRGATGRVASKAFAGNASNDMGPGARAFIEEPVVSKQPVFPKSEIVSGAPLVPSSVMSSNIRAHSA